VAQLEDEVKAELEELRARREELEKGKLKIVGFNWLYIGL
jgi:hypothetical protein